MRRSHLLPLILFAASAAQAQTEIPPQLALPEGAALIDSIREADSALFGLFFTGCDANRLRPMISEDLEFYHDKGGLVATSGAQFVSEYATNCEARNAPDAWRSRRELVPESVHVDPVPGFGAMEVGEHLFYERQGDGPEKLVGRAGFAMVWRWDDGVWKLHRVLSFGHKPVPAAP